MFICLLASLANAGLWGESVGMVDLKDQRTLADDFTDFSINNKPVSFPADIRGPKSWGPRPDNPGYIHFIERPNEGNPPFVTVAPEPVSYLLFIVGAAALSGNVYLKKKVRLRKCNHSTNVIPACRESSLKQGKIPDKPE